MAPFGKRVLFSLFLIVVLDPASTDSIKPNSKGVQQILVRGNPRSHVRIFNHLEGNDGNTSLTIHCKSRDDDLGTHVIDSHECFGWKFHPNFRDTTLFFCHLSWMGGSGTYDIYKEKRDYDRCIHFCDWYVTKDGIAGWTEADITSRKWKRAKQDIFFKWES